MAALLPLLAFLLVAGAGGGGLGNGALGTDDATRPYYSSDSEVMAYWKRVLPNSPMPLALVEHLNSFDDVDDDKTSFQQSVHGEREDEKVTFPWSQHTQGEDEKTLFQKGPQMKGDDERVTLQWSPHKEQDGEKATLGWGLHHQGNDGEVTSTPNPQIKGEDKATFGWRPHTTSELKDKVTMWWGQHGEDDTDHKVTLKWGSNMKSDGKVTHQWGPNMKNDEKITHQWGPHMRNDEKVTHQWGPNMRNDERVTQQWGSNMKNDEKVTHQWGPHMRNDGKVTHQWGPHMRNDGKLTHQWGPHMRNDGKVTYQWGPNMKNDGKVTHQWGPNMKNDEKVIHEWGPNMDGDVEKVIGQLGSHTNGDDGKATLGWRSDDQNVASLRHGSHIREGHHQVHGTGHNHGQFDLENLLFLEAVLTPGTLMAPYIEPSVVFPPPFLPREIADSIPISTKNFTDILSMFAPMSLSIASKIWSTLDTCEHPHPLEGERQACAMSIESIVELAASVLRTRDVRAFSSSYVPVEGFASPLSKYKVAAVRAITAPDEEATTMTCHGVTFPYAVFYCHAVNPMRVYDVTLQSVEGDGAAEAATMPAGKKTMQALAVCHLDTSQFHPENPFFVARGLKPGDAAVCHFLSRDSVLWAPAASTQGHGQVAAQ